MTQSVRQAVSSSAGFGNAGNRHSRREQDTGAFGGALAMPKPKTARMDAGPSEKLGVNGRAWHRTEQQPGTAATAFDGSMDAANRPTSDLDDGHLAAFADDVDATADEADAQSEPGADEPIGDGLPMQIRAEQAISAIMTLSRQTAATQPASEAPDAARGGEADSAMPGALASEGDKPPLAQHAAEPPSRASHARQLRCNPTQSRSARPSYA